MMNMRKRVMNAQLLFLDVAPSAKPLDAIESDEKQSDNEINTEVASVDETPELKKPKGLAGPFPFDLASELKKRVSGSAKFALKPSSSNVDIFNKGKSKIDVETFRRKDNDDDAGAGQENLSFKDKLKLIERSSSKILVNPL